MNKTNPKELFSLFSHEPFKEDFLPVFYEGIYLIHTIHNFINNSDSLLKHETLEFYSLIESAYKALLSYKAVPKPERQKQIIKVLGRDELVSPYDMTCNSLDNVQKSLSLLYKHYIADKARKVQIHNYYVRELHSTSIPYKNTGVPVSFDYKKEALNILFNTDNTEPSTRSLNKNIANTNFYYKSNNTNKENSTSFLSIFVILTFLIISYFLIKALFF